MKDRRQEKNNRKILSIDEEGAKRTQAVWSFREYVTGTKTKELPIPDYVFEAILEERKTYEKNRRRRKTRFLDAEE